VYTAFVKNITFSADPDLIDKARQIAKSEHKTLNVAFREWLADYTARAANVHDYRALMERLQHLDSVRKYTRDEMNER
jgi:predicted transcriptional regulator